jgi:hypothetical protein
MRVRAQGEGLDALYLVFGLDSLFCTQVLFCSSFFK